MAIEQHPIPQDVAGYKFRLIGEMTIKQFAFLASGIILGLIVYSLPLPFFFKYPLAAVAVGLGAGIAFLPVEGRPMDKWLIAFIKSVYSPTQYVWQKQDGTEVVSAKVTPPTPKAAVAASTNVPTTAPPPPPPAAPTSGMLPQSPVIPTVSSPTPTPIPAVTQTKPEPIVPAEISTSPTPPSIPITPPPAPSSPLPEITPQTPTPSPEKVSPSTATAPTAQVTSTLPIPFTPTSANTLVGMTLTPEGKILENALIEIKSKGVSLRATKSNQLGQFLFAKPLENGLYQILTERPGFVFDTYSIELRGQIVKPLRLQAKANAQ